MGVVASQSFRNLFSTYFGFAIGAINTLFLYVQFFSEEHYGLISYLLSIATILTPIIAFGVNNTLIKFYSLYSEDTANRFLTWMMLLPLAIIIPGTILTAIGQETILSFFSSENEIARPYIFITFLIALAMAYFEIFYSWAKVMLQSVLGNFIKEVFHRLGIMILLFMYYLKWLDLNSFIYGILAVYVIRMLVMMVYAFKLRAPVFDFSLPEDFSRILQYSILIIIAGSISVMILEIDMFMIGKLTAIENVAFYSVAIYIATVIAVPGRAMQQITSPLTAQYLNKNNFKELADLYKKSSLTLLIISGLIFLLIIANIKQLYLLLDPSYSNGLLVVWLIGLAKLFDNIMGNNNGIVYNSEYYRLVLVLGVILIVIAIGLNIILIPWLGINGAAIATFMASIGYGLSKIILVKLKFNMQPFTQGSFKVLFLMIALILGFYFWDFNFHPLISIAIKSLLITIIYVFIVYRFSFSNEINTLLNNLLHMGKSRSD